MNTPSWLFTTGSDNISLRNPANPSEVATERRSSRVEDVEAAAARNAEAFRSWRLSTVAERSAILHRTGEILRRDEAEIARTITRETGKHIRDSLGEVRNAVGLLQYYAGRAWNSKGTVLPSVRPGTSLRTFKEPLGVVGLISPWNFPINLLAVKVAPALAAGDALVIKPSTIGSSASLMLIEALYEAGLPEGVASVVIGDGRVIGDALVRAPGLDAISFTGSTAVGNAVALEATRLGRRHLCEMGGKNASVVMGDADLDLAVETLINASFGASGQKCTATSRIILVKPVAEEFADRFRQRLGSLRFGDPFDEEAFSGPVVNRQQFDSIVDVVQSNLEQGTPLLSEWNPPQNPDQDGYFVPPTVFTDVAPESKLFQEEVFGPVVGVAIAEDLGEAIELVNYSDYGLSASIFTKNIDHAARFERDVACGVVNVNLPTSGLEYQTPYAGWKDSGTSYLEQGDEALTFYTKSKSVAVRASL